MLATFNLFGVLRYSLCIPKNQGYCASKVGLVGAGTLDSEVGLDKTSQSLNDLFR